MKVSQFEDVRSFHQIISRVERRDCAARDSQLKNDGVPQYLSPFGDAESGRYCNSCHTRCKASSIFTPVIISCVLYA